MRSTKPGARGFTLIATLLMLLLLSGIAIGLMMMVNTESRAGGTDLQNNVAYHAAEGGIEKMTSDLAAAFQSAQAPTAADICALSNKPPVLQGVTWKDYQVQPKDGCGAPVIAPPYGQIQAGPNQGLYAQLVPVTMQATAEQIGGQEVSMMRQAQVALIPVFQFGVFSDSDVGFYASPNLTFAGRVHTNGDLYVGVANNAQLTFKDKITAFGNVVRQRLPNGLDSNSFNNTGTVLIPQQSGGCNAGAANGTCRAIALTEGSVSGMGGRPPQSSLNSSWPTISLSTYNGMILDADWNGQYGTGAKNLKMPFVNDTTHPYELIRRATLADSVALSQSREFNLAQIRVLLSDDPCELDPLCAANPEVVRLANVPNAGVDNTRGVQVTVGGLPATRTTYFAEGTSVGVKDPTGANACLSNANFNALPLDWPNQPAAAPAGARTLPGAAPLLPTANTWDLLDGYLLVQYKDVAGNWNSVTRQWLQLGFARGTTPPALPGTPNPIHPNAILILQQPADRNGNGTVNGLAGAQASDNAGAGCNGGTPNPRPAELQLDPTTGSPFYGDNTQATSVTRNNWYPINFYDTREGEPRDVKAGNNSCSVNGVMNAVELDVGNLKRWLWGQIGASGPNVDFVAQNGYVLYFSDRRGMLKNPNAANQKTGESGLEDVVNRASAAGAPDGILEPVAAGYPQSPEDVNQNGLLDSFGAANLGLGFFNAAAPNAGNLNNSITAINPDNPFVRINSCTTTARKNWVSGARHVLKLVDGSLGNVPLRQDLVNAGSLLAGGFTVASENPVYIQGNYNSNAGDPAWGNPPADNIASHANAAVIADAVTILSNNWNDRISMTATPSDATTRPATTTYYRVAVAGGKNINFPFPGWENNTNFGTGTDGGVHNFLRFLENWNGDVLNYQGSLVSLYYATYNTGIFKCCVYSVYQPPTRNYAFDFDFAKPLGLPPGTPLFRDVDTLGYRQLFAVRNK